jgi:single-strand DNA-binding protein
MVKYPVNVILRQPYTGKGENMNSVNVIGRLTKDPEIRKTDEGITICSLRLAVDDTFSKEDRADFINVTVFGAQGDVCEKYLRKGFICGVSGRIRSDVYTDAEGVKRYPVKLTAERVQFLQWPEREAAKEAV